MWYVGNTRWSFRKEGMMSDWEAIVLKLLSNDWSVASAISKERANFIKTKNNAWSLGIIKMLNDIKETFDKRMSADADLRLFMEGELLSLLSSPNSENVLQGLTRLAESRGLISLLTFWPEDVYYFDRLHDHLPALQERKVENNWEEEWPYLACINIIFHWDYPGNILFAEMFLLSNVIREDSPFFPLYKAGLFSEMFHRVCDGTQWNELPTNLQHHLLNEKHIMVPVPHQNFLMGALPNDAEAYSNEKPQHEVQLSRQFAMGKYPVTALLWHSVMEYTPESNFNDTKMGLTRPMVNVSWNDCIVFCKNSVNNSSDPIKLFKSSDKKTSSGN